MPSGKPAFQALEGRSTPHKLVLIRGQQKLSSCLKSLKNKKALRKA